MYDFLLSRETGILEGVKAECDFTLANNAITFKDGYVSIYGRIIYIEDKTSIVVSPDSDKFGFVVLGVNTSDNSASIYLKEQTGSYPSLTRSDLANTQGLYEFVLATYTKTITSVTINENSVRSFIKKDKSRITDLGSEIYNRYTPQRIQIVKINSGVYQFHGTSPGALSESIIYVTINNSVVVTLPGEALFLFVGSNTSVAYRYGGADYSLDIIYEDETVTLTVGSTYHNITSVFMKR